jgi:putative colanic acid biosynthesis glycosyltransferase WcaI
MRILILSINYWPEETGIGSFTTYRAEYLARAGHEVTVCTTFPYYPEWKVAGSYRGKWWTTETRNGVRIHRTRAYVPNPVTTLRRIVHEGSYVAGSLMRAMTTGRPDVILAVSPPLGLAMSTNVLSRLWRRPYVFDVEDLQPDAAAEMGMLPGWTLRALYALEQLAYRNAAIVSTITRGMQRRIVEKGIEAEKVVLFEPRADESLFELVPEEGLAFRKKYGLEGRFVVTHSGNIGVKQGLDVILDAAMLSRKDSEMQYLIVGAGADQERIKQRARQMALENVRFLPVLDAVGFRGLLAASDVCLVTQRKTASEIAFPSKTVTYMAAGCAVIASVKADSEVAQCVRESGAGTVVQPEDGDALREAIESLRRSGLEEYRTSARAYARSRWSSERVLGFLERSLVAVRHAKRTALTKQEIRQ